MTELLRECRRGSDDALTELMTVLQAELHTLAERQLRGERSDHTLQATALVNEAYLRLAGADVEWQDRVHFLSVAARVMRRVLVDHARARAAERRGGGMQRIGLEDTASLSSDRPTDFLELDEALRTLAHQDERKARIVELHYFSGLTHPEIAGVVGVSPATVDRDLRFSRAWLREQLAD